MHPRYGWPLAGRYCTCAGFFNLSWRMVVTISFGQHCERNPGPVHLSENRDGEGPEEQHSSNNHSKSDFLPIKLLIYIVLKFSSAETDSIVGINGLPRLRP